MTVKPDLTRVWAVDAPGVNVVDPSTTTPDKFADGWTAEVPPFEHFNFIQKQVTEGLAHINEQGIAVWDDVTTYPVGALAKGSDGNVYKALISQSDNDPVSDGGTNWRNWEVGIRVTLVSELPATSTEGFQALVSGVPYVYKSSAWIPQFGYVTPDGYGAVADGATDDAAAIVAALATGYQVVIPGKNYAFASGFGFQANDQTLTGIGWESQLSQIGSSDYLSTNGFDRVTLSNLRVNGPGAGFLRVNNGSSGVQVKGVFFSGGSQRVWVFATTELTVSGCHFEDTGYQIIQQNGYVSSQVKVIGNTSINCTGDFVLMNCEDGFQSKNWLIANNTVKNVGGSASA